MEYKWVGLHPQDLASGRVLEPGETAELSDEEIKDPHNAALIADGNFIPLDEKASQPNATEGAIELADQHSVDLASLSGSGAAGRITKEDVERHLAQVGGETE